MPLSEGPFFMNYFDKNAVYEFWKIHSSERNEKKLHQKLLRNFSMSVHLINYISGIISSLENYFDFY
jgi:hypothetical protein